jgi:hypothetical protein
MSQDEKQPYEEEAKRSSLKAQTQSSYFKKESSLN